MLQTIDNWTSAFASFVWGLPLLVLLVGGGLFLAFRSGFLPFKYIAHAIQVLRGKYDNEQAEGEITHFQALLRRDLIKNKSVSNRYKHFFCGKAG